MPKSVGFRSWLDRHRYGRHCRSPLRWRSTDRGDRSPRKVANRPTPGKDPAVASTLRRLLLLVPLLLPGFAFALPVTAQDKPTDSTAAYLPSAATLGDDWALASTGSLGLPTELFRAGTL